MNPRRFLVIGGSVLVVMGGLGVGGWLDAISRAALFRPPYWINWVHLAIGTSALAIAARGGNRLQAGITLFPAVVGTTGGLAGLLFGRLAADRFNVPDLADPSEHLAHLAVGLLALWGWLGRSFEPFPRVQCRCR
jgi:hypothetical protein